MPPSSITSSTSGSQPASSHRALPTGLTDRLLPTLHSRRLDLKTRHGEMKQSSARLSTTDAAHQMRMQLDTSARHYNNAGEFVQRIHDELKAPSMVTAGLCQAMDPGSTPDSDGVMSGPDLDDERISWRAGLKSAHRMVSGMPRYTLAIMFCGTMDDKVNVVSRESGSHALTHDRPLSVLYCSPSTQIGGRISAGPCRHARSNRVTDTWRRMTNSERNTGRYAEPCC